MTDSLRPDRLLLLFALSLCRPAMALPPRAPQAPQIPALLRLTDLERLAIENSPILKRAEAAIGVATGRFVQAGLYPNPQLQISGEELGSPQGSFGLITAPFLTQTIVTKGKLKLSSAVAAHRIDQAGLGLVAQRLTVLTQVRQGYFDVLAKQRRVEVLSDLVGVAEKSFDVIHKLVKSGQAAQLDLLQIRAGLNELRASLAAAKRQQLASWRNLTATLGLPHLPQRRLIGKLEKTAPLYGFEESQKQMLREHPNVLSARVGVSRAQLALDRARAGAYPNVNVGAGYQRNDKDNENTWTFQVTVPLPVFNRNQGTIQASAAQVTQAIHQVQRAENRLIQQLAMAFGNYEAARDQAELYRKSILPDTREAFKLAQAAYDGGQFSYLRVLQALRANQQANLQYVNSLARMWQAVSAISGLLLEELPTVESPAKKLKLPAPPSKLPKPIGNGSRVEPSRTKKPGGMAATFLNRIRPGIGNR